MRHNAQPGAAAATPVTLAMLRFANLDQMPLAAITDMYRTLIDHRHVWQDQVKTLAAAMYGQATPDRHADQPQ